MTTDDEQEQFYELIGRCITQWVHVEDSAYELYAIAVHQEATPRASNMPMQGAYYAISSPEGKLAMTDAAVKMRLLIGMGQKHDDPQRRLFAAWLKLKKTLDERRGRRNLLAHYQPLIDLKKPEGRRWQLRAPLFNPNVLFKSTPSVFHIDELEATRRSFGKASFALRCFSYGIARHFGQRELNQSDEENLVALLKATVHVTVTQPPISYAE